MMRVRKHAIAVASVAVTSIGALASDQSIELATGGLNFVRHASLEIVLQDIAISVQEVRSRYRVLNKSEAPLAIVIAFPLPDIHVDGPNDSISIPTKDAENLLGFTINVNGKPIIAAVEQRAMVVGLDRTQILRSMGVPLAPHLLSTRQALDALPGAKWEQLLRIGAAEIEEYDTGSGLRKHLSPRWTLESTYYWEQTFAAEAVTLIELRYKPSIGHLAQTALGSPNQEKQTWFDDYKEKDCLNYEFLAAVERVRRAANSKSTAPFSEHRIEYLLKIAANTATAVAQFRFTIDKGGPENLVSFCGAESFKADETTVEVKKTDYIPDGSVPVLILQKLPP
jgi:Domain of unknown function (DUF4424)